MKWEDPLNLSILLREEKKLTRIPLVTASEAGKLKFKIHWSNSLWSCNLERLSQCQPGYKSLETGHQRG